jgi:hypothetical protein
MHPSATVALRRGASASAFAEAALLRGSANVLADNWRFLNDLWFCQLQMDYNLGM